MTDELTFRAGLRDTLPTVFGYIGIGMAFGLVAHSSGLSLLVIFLLSSVVFAGSAQFIMVSMLVAVSPLASIVLAVFLVNSRMILLSMTMAPIFKEESLLKNVWIGTLLTDESFALGMAKRNVTHDMLTVSWFSAANLLSYLVWNVSSLLGALLGGLIPNPQKFGLGFAISGMFIGLLFLQISTDRKLSVRMQLTMVLVTLILTFISLIFLPSTLTVLMVTLVTCGLGMVIKNAFHL